MPHKAYTLILGPEDYLSIEFDIKKGVLNHFVIQYYAIIKGKWCTIIRVDNAHGFPHKHVYHLRSKEFKVKLNQENNKVFNKYKKSIEVNYLAIKENYLNT